MYQIIFVEINRAPI